MSLKYCSIEDFGLNRKILRSLTQTLAIFWPWIFWSPSFDSQMFSSHGSSVFCDVATIKILDIVWNHFWKRGKRPKKRRGGVFGKSQFCREKKKQRKKSETREIWLWCGWCVSNIGLNFHKTSFKKTQMHLSFPSRTAEPSWIIKVSVNLFQDSPYRCLRTKHWNYKIR